jgi:hypothetical protein
VSGSRGDVESQVESQMDARILRLTEPVVFFPVRHHSPACARLVSVLAERLRPKAILIEGPSDFNPSLGELHRAHELPIAIYSYVRLGAGIRRGAFYPFCVYSPEWQALQASRRLATPARFIDLPYRDRALRSPASHLYADTQERRGSYFESLAAAMALEGFDNLWDTLFEIDASLDVETYFERVHRLMFHARVTDVRMATWSDQRREAFMAGQIAAAQAEFGAPLLVVTGGFHSYALFARLHGIAFEDALPEPPANVSEPPMVANEPHLVADDPAVTDHGIALTPYSYERLDALTGYDAGMPNPGFYHRVWDDRQAARSDSYRAMLAQAAAQLRVRKQPVSTADLIAVESMARGLANLRGHAAVWRQDLVDGVTAAAIKEELSAGGRHPFLDALHQALRGNRRGRLAAGTALPPIVADIERQIQAYDLEPEPGARSLVLDLHTPEDLARVRVLHQLAVVNISGFALTGGAPIARPGDTSALIERWRIQWSPEFDANCIEAAIYGATLSDASRARLVELANSMERSASGAANLLLESCLMGHLDLSRDFHTRLLELLRQDGDFVSVGAALATLLYVYRYDDVLGSAWLSSAGEILAEAYDRALWLIESCGARQGEEPAVVFAIRALRDTLERCGEALGLDRGEFVTILRRAAAASRWATFRGALTGALWSLSEATLQEIGADLPRTSDPQHLGDFLVGLFHVAREVAQRSPALLAQIDALMQEMDAEDFLAALPPLRLAFSVFTPREKELLVGTLFHEQGPEPVQYGSVQHGSVQYGPVLSSPTLDVPDVLAARHLAWEARLLDDMARYGIRGGRRS